MSSMNEQSTINADGAEIISYILYIRATHECMSTVYAINQIFICRRAFLIQFSLFPVDSRAPPVSCDTWARSAIISLRLTNH